MRQYRPFLLLGLAAIIAFTTSSVAYRWLRAQSPEETVFRGALEVRDLRQESADEFVASLEYVKDSRTGLCFAFYRNPWNRGGDTVMLVDCSRVPKEELTESPKTPTGTN